MCHIISDKHTALFYESKEGYLDVVLPFIESGLRNNEFVLWTIPECISVEEARFFLRGSLANFEGFIRKEQILIQDYETTYMKDGIFFSQGAVANLKELEKSVLEKGFNGICAVGDGEWALGDLWMDFLAYESKINRIIDDHKMKAVCTYPKKNMEIGKVLDIGKNHQEVIVKQRGEWNKLTPADFQLAV